MRKLLALALLGLLAWMAFKPDDGPPARPLPSPAPAPVVPKPAPPCPT